MTDQELIKKIQNGQKEFLGEIIERYYDDILRFCRYQTGDAIGAYDLTQETFLKFMKYIGSFRYRNLKGYLLTIAGNLCRDYFRSRASGEILQSAETVEQLSGSLPELLSHTGEADKILEDTENKLLLRELLLRLPKSQREVIILRYYHDCKLTEISGILGVNLSTVKSRLRMGTQALRKEMEALDEG